MKSGFFSAIPSPPPADPGLVKERRVVADRDDADPRQVPPCGEVLKALPAIAPRFLQEIAALDSRRSKATKLMSVPGFVRASKTV